MRLLLSGLLLSVSPAALALDYSAWEFDLPAAAEMADEQEANIPVAVADPVWDVRISSDLTTMMTGETLRVPMPDGQSFNGQVTINRPTASGGRHLQIEFDQPGEGVLIHVGLNATYGRIWTAEGEFVIEPGPAGGSILRTAPEEPLFDDGIADERIHAFSDIAEAEVDGIQAGADTLDFLYFYDADMITTHGWGLPDLAATDIGNLQTALTTSGVPLFSDLTQLQFMDVAQDYASDDLLTDAGNRSGVFDGLQARVDSLGIDVISLNRVYDSDRESFCGLGYVHNPESDFTGRSHINVCHNGLTLAHETGHNMGLAHGIETDGSTGRPVDWARGFRIDSANADGGIFTSVMAYGSGRRPQFSDPTLRCPERGSVCGIPLDPADNSVGSYATEALRRYAVGFPAQAVPNRRLRSSVLPTSRFVTTGSAATAFMTVINPNQVDGTNCVIEHHGPNRENFSYQRTDPATNALVGTADTPVDIPAGAVQTFLISLTPAADVSGVRFAPYASCDNVPMAEVSPGLNTVDLGADAAGGPDIIALSATIGNNGIVDVPDGRRGVFSVATVNLGGAGDVTVSAQSLDPDLPATGQVCQTDAAGACMAPAADSLTLNIGPNETPTFGVFVRTTYATPFSARQRFQFQTQVGGVIRGSTSVAVRDAAAIVPPAATAHALTVTAFGSQTGNLASYATGYFDRFEVVTQPALGSVELNGSTGSYTYTAGALGGSDSFTYRAGNSSGWSPAMTATVTVNGLPLPVVSAFTIPDDTDGTFQVDLDDHADSNIEIDRFLLTSAPSISHTFDPLTGILNISLPSDPGSVTFEFAAENRSGQGTSAAGEVTVIAYDICAPSNITRSRLQRRLGEIDVTTFGAVSMAEAESLGTTLCMTETGREPGQFVRFRNTDRGIQVLIALDDTEYDIYMANDGATNWEAIFPMCKTVGESRLTAC
jgi:Metallo-peptidase family M12B Reprolysin-like/Bacterial Ig domain